MNLCPVCLRKLQYSIGFDVVSRYRNLLQFYRPTEPLARRGWKVGFEEESQWIIKRLRGIVPDKAAKAFIEEKNPD